jgi:hypothetical protein
MPTTQISQRFIADGAINDAKVQAGAAIATSKLALSGTIVLKDGSAAFTGNQSMGGNLLTNVGTPSSSTDAATKAYVDTAIGNLNGLFDSKGSAKAASVANVTVSNPGTAVFDGVTLNSGDRLFLRVQSAAAENGIYVFNGSGSALTRATDMDAWTEIPGSFFAIEEGSTYADTIWLCTANAGGTLGTTSIPFQQIPTSAGLTASNFADKEAPSGSINGANTAFTLAFTPVAGSEHVYLNGILLESGAGNDYTITGAAITLLTAPLTGEKLRVSYRK